jgi:hypothetical protein
MTRIIIFYLSADLDPVEEEDGGEIQKTKRKAYSHKEVCILKKTKYTMKSSFKKIIQKIFITALMLFD